MLQKVMTDCTLSVLQFCLQKPIYLQGVQRRGGGGRIGGITYPGQILTNFFGIRILGHLTSKYNLKVTPPNRFLRV